MHENGINRTKLILMAALILLAVAIPALFICLTSSDTEANTEITVYFNDADEYHSMDFFEFATGCVAYSITPEDTEYPEALQALCIAVKCRLLYIMGSCSHENCDICDDPDHGGGYISKSDYKKLYGSDGADGWAAISEAMDATKAICVCYNDQIALTLTHRSSYLLTENAFELTDIPLPYLVSVRTYESVSPKTISVSADVVHAVLNTVYGIENAGEITISSRTSSGRTARVSINGVTIDAREFADLMGLATCNFEVEYDENQYIFTTYGDGSGIGMSIEGAKIMDTQGSDFEEILHAYYLGCDIRACNVAELIKR